MFEKQSGGGLCGTGRACMERFRDGGFPAIGFLSAHLHHILGA